MPRQGEGGCFRLGLMAAGFTALGIGLMIWTGAGLAGSSPGPIVIALTVLGASMYVIGVGFEIRDWISARRNT